MHNKLWNNLKIYDKETVEKTRSITFKHNLFVKALACGRKSKRATFYNCKAFLGLAAISDCPSDLRFVMLAKIEFYKQNRWL